MNKRSPDYKWNGSGIKLLLALFKERKSDLQDPIQKKRDVWRGIVQELERNGIKGLDVDKVSRKFRNLKRTYRSLKLKNKSTRQGTTKWEHFNDMEDIFNEDCKIFASSTISSFQEENSEDSMIFNASDCIQIFSTSNEEDSSSSFLKSTNKGEINTPAFKKSKTFVQKQCYSQTNKIIQIEEGRNESLARIANAMEESNRLFQKYISILESQPQ